jgi:hypothetical protein
MRVWGPNVLDSIKPAACCFNMQRNRFHGRWQYLLLESVCEDAATLEVRNWTRVTVRPLTFNALFARLAR